MQGGIGTAPVYTDRQSYIEVDGVRLVRAGRNASGPFEVRAVLLGDRVTFVGGRDGAHSIHHHSTAERILAHWEGYCAGNDLALREGAIVVFRASGVWRKAPVLVEPTRASTTVQVGGFEFRNGRKAKPRRIRKVDLRVVQQPPTE